MESSLRSNLVIGEAPESDEEDDMPQITTMSKSAHADLVAGEASESDEECVETKLSIDCNPMSSNLPSSDTQTHPTNKPDSTSVQYDSVLHRKLREHNYLLQTSIKDFLHQTSCRAIKTLNNSNQQLMKTQIMLQDTASALKLCSNNMNIVHNKLSSSLKNTTIPDIKIELPSPIPRSY